MAQAHVTGPGSSRSAVEWGEVQRLVLRGYLKKKREVVVPWTMHPAIKVYQLFPGLVERTMIKMARGVK